MPLSFDPHIHTVPSARKARLWELPAAMAMMFERPAIGSGDGTVPPLVPFPSVAGTFDPHPQTVPSLRRARLWPPPAEMAITPSRAGTCCGVPARVGPPTPRPSWL
jgi:hypothetical protein